MQYPAKSKCMFHTSTNPCRTEIFLVHHPYVISLVAFCRILSWFPLCSCVKFDLFTSPCHWYSQPNIGWLHQVQSTVHCEYTKSRSVFNRVENSVNINSTEDREYDVAREYNYHVESVYWFQRGWNLYTKQRQKTRTKYQSKMIKMQ